MAELILRDADGVEVGRRPMAPEHRFTLYEQCRDRQLFQHAGQQYTLITVAYDRTAEQCICTVVYGDD
jgi:hypothetical protein